MSDNLFFRHIVLISVRPYKSKLETISATNSLCGARPQLQSHLFKLFWTVWTSLLDLLELVWSRTKSGRVSLNYTAPTNWPCCGGFASATFPWFIIAPDSAQAMFSLCRAVNQHFKCMIIRVHHHFKCMIIRVLTKHWGKRAKLIVIMILLFVN